jgi:tRNA nucleotidyltransferase (CCA-adding enzyme)
LQLSTAHSRALEWAGTKTTRISKTLSGDALLRPSQIYRLLLDLPDEALALVLAKGWTRRKGGGTGRLRWRLKTYLTRDRHVTTTINGETLKRLGLQPGPQFRKILDRLLDERLDARITTPAEEQHRARALAKHYG